MKDLGRLLWLAVGMTLGVAGALCFNASPRLALAGNDRSEDYIITTGPVTLGVNEVGDGIWILDYRAGKLLGAAVDRKFGRISPWAEVDLVKEFGIAPKQNVHFMMTTGAQVGGQSVLYLTEVNTGRFGIYTMVRRPDGRGMMVNKHDATVFRPQPANP